MRQPIPGAHPGDLGTIFAEAEGELRAVLRRFHIPEEDAEDLLQDTAVAFLTRADSVSAPRPWLIAVLRRKCLLFWRSRRRRLIDAVDGSLLEQFAEEDGNSSRSDLRRDLSNALSHLPRRCRTILGMRYGLECSGPEIAERIGSRADAVRQATLRCLSALTRRLVSVGFVEEAP